VENNDDTPDVDETEAEVVEAWDCTLWSLDTVENASVKGEQESDDSLAFNAWEWAAGVETDAEADAGSDADAGSESDEEGDDDDDDDDDDDEETAAVDQVTMISSATATIAAIAMFAY
jgi:hypothetical protein